MKNILATEDNKYVLNNTSIDFSITKRSDNITFWERLKTIDSPLLKSFWKFFKIMVEFIFIAFIVVSVTFFLINAVPGSNSLTAGLDETSRRAIEAQYGLDLPLFKRYLNYMWELVQGRFGISLSLFPGREISAFIWERFYISFLVGIFSVALTVGIGIPLGIVVGKNPGGIIDNVSTVVISFFSSTPPIVLGLFLLLVGRESGISYIFSVSDFSTFILPGIALSLPSMIVYVKYIRTELNRELNSVHAKFAYLKGLTKSRFVWKQAIKPSLFPIATFFPAVILGSFLGSLFIERIFQIPGSGDTFLSSIQTKDYNVLLFLIVMFSIIIILSYALRDILYELIDPRIRRSGK